ncbi:hypothetical protein pb186bvf_000354 [Paramecium bursaria]
MERTKTTNIQISLILLMVDKQLTHKKFIIKPNKKYIILNQHQESEFT